MSCVRPEMANLQFHAETNRDALTRVEAERDRLREQVAQRDRDVKWYMQTRWRDAAPLIADLREQVRALREALVKAADSLEYYAGCMRRTWDAPQHARTAYNDASKARVLTRTEAQP